MRIVHYNNKMHHLPLKYNLLILVSFDANHSLNANHYYLGLLNQNSFFGGVLWPAR